MSAIKQPKRWAVWKQLLLGLVSIILLYIGYRAWIDYRYAQELRAVLTQLEREDPHWTWEKIQAKQQALPAAENSALEVVELLKLTNFRETIPSINRHAWARQYQSFHSNDNFLQYDFFIMQHPNARLPGPIKEIIEPWLAAEPGPTVLKRARALQSAQSGRFDYSPRKLLMWSLLPDLQGAREICRLLSHDADLQMLRNQTSLAIENIQGILGLARCFSHDSFLVAQLVRMAITNQAAHLTHRLLAQSLPLTADQLLALQSAFEKELANTRDLLTAMMRSERAISYHDLNMLAEQKVTYSEVAQSLGLSYKWSTGYPPADHALANHFPEMLFGWGARPGNHQKERTLLLQYWNEAVRWSRLPEHQWMPALETWRENGPLLTPFIRQYSSFDNRMREKDNAPELNLLNSMARAVLTNRAQLRAITAVIACERYRLEQRTWPASLAALVPSYLNEIPVDPFTAKPLFFKLLPDGLAIYSVGRNMLDDGGHVVSDESSPKDAGFRLWNPGQRGLNMDEVFKQLVKQAKQE